MERRHGPWLIRRSSEVYRDGFIRVASDDVTRPDGNPCHYATVLVKPGFAVLPVNERGIVYLDTSIVHCPVILYVARGLTFDEPDREGTEVMRSVAMSIGESVRLIQEGEICHAAN